MKYKIFFGLLFSILSSQSSAENGCPDGMTPFQNGNDPVPKCYPIQGGQNSAPAQPRGRWETRWGAYAIDGSKGRLGASTGAKSKKQAIKAAIAQCRLNGGADGCKKGIFSYYNQCVAVAWGDTTYRGSGRPTLEEATKDTMQSCSLATSNCKVVYADCTSAEWVQ
jgi:Domain of unknown function (DUF4189)